MDRLSVDVRIGFDDVPVFPPMLTGHRHVPTKSTVERARGSPWITKDAISGVVLVIGIQRTCIFAYFFQSYYE
jgi:hypothetical protein